MNTNDNSIQKPSTDFEEFLVKEKIVPFQIQKQSLRNKDSPDHSTPFTMGESHLVEGDQRHVMLNNPSGPSGLSNHHKGSNKNASFLAYRQ